MYKIITFIGLLLTSTAFAQNNFTDRNNKSGNITGKVADSVSNEPLPFATVSIFKPLTTKDSLVGGMAIPISGQFQIANMPKGKLVLKVTFVGYQTFSRNIDLASNTIDLGTIKLSADSKMLQEVQVKAEKEQVSMGLDKRVFNVAKSLTSIGGTAESLLRNVPSVNIDENGSATIHNMATTIYINGKPTQLTLAQIPANQIESVEVISNPSARYEASTSGGIVNLVLKKNREAGFNGSVSAGVGSNNRYDGSLNLDYHEGNWNFTGLYNLNSTKNPLAGFVNRTNFINGEPVNYFNQNTSISLNNVFQNGRIAIDFTPDKFNTFSVSGTLIGGSFNTITNQKYEYLNTKKAITSFGTRNTTPANSFTNKSAEFDWRRTFAKKGESISLVTSYTNNNVSNGANWLTTGQNADGSNLPFYPETNKITGQQIGSQYLAQLDYAHPLNDSTKIEMGLRSYTYGRDIQYFFNQLNNESQTYSLLQSYSQDANILETINAAYFLYNHKLKNNITMEAGLRIEQSFLHGKSRFDNTSFGYNYPSASGKGWFQAFFPSFAINKTINENSEIGLSLSRKVGRPNFRHLFIGIQSSDRQNITIGNPKIQPEFVNTAELNYNTSFGSLSWLASAYYIYEDHTIKPFTQPSATDPTILVTTVINAKADIQYGMDNTLKYTIGAFSTTANFNLFNFIIQTNTLQNKLWIYRAKLNLTYKLPANISFQINLNRDSKSPSLQGYRLPVQAADFAIRKAFMGNRASVAFSVNDVFNSRKFYSVYENENTFQTTMNRRDVRFFKFTLTLPLGKANLTFKKKDNKIDKPDIDFSN